MCPQPPTEATPTTEATPDSGERRDPDASTPGARFVDRGRAGLRRLRARAPELAVTVAALVFFGWGVSKNGYGQTYYAAAVRSMGGSWRNFLFGSFDPGGWITTDKPPLALWLETVSTRVFGYSSFALFLPSVLCGAAAVWLLMSAVRSAWGRWAGLVAGVALAFTPVVVAVSRSDDPDATLLLCLVAAGYATQRAITRRRPGWLAVAGLACGLAFLTKLLVAGVVVPGIVLAYIVTGPIGWWRRLRDLTVAGAVFLLIAGGWVALFDLTPASSRPYVANSTNNTAQDLIFGYNGFGRLTGSNGGGGFGRVNVAGNGGPGANAFGGTPGIGRLFNGGMGDQVMWLVVFAGVALVAGLVVAIRHRRRDARTASLVIWGGLGIVSYFVFAYTQGTFHNYYVAAFAPAVAALVGIGFELVRRGGRGAAAWLAVGAIGTAAVQVALLRRVPAYEALRMIVPVVLVLVAVGGVAVALISPGVRRVLGALAGLAVVTALVAPAAWAAAAVRHPATSMELTARPQGASAERDPGAGARRGFGGFRRFGGGGFRTAGISAPELAWLRQQRHGESWVLAVQNAREAAPAIIGGDSVMAMGGFQGTDPAMTRAKLAGLVQHHRLRFVAPGGAPQATNQISALVGQACMPVDAAMWGGSGPSGLYDCTGRASAIRTAEVSAPPAQGAGGLLRGRPQDVRRLVTCLQRHGWDPTSGPGPAFSRAIGACSNLVRAAVGRSPTSATTRR